MIQFNKTKVHMSKEKGLEGYVYAYLNLYVVVFATISRWLDYY